MSRNERRTAADAALAATRDHENAADEFFGEPGLPGTIACDHHALREETARIRALLARACEDAIATLELHARLTVFARNLSLHFRSEEATCAAPGRHAASAARWLSELAAEHLELERRIERSLGEVASASRERRCLPAEGREGLCAFFTELEAHELSEMRLFEIAQLGH